MAVITRLVFRGVDEVVVRRAPQNKVFLVEAIMIIAQTSTTNNQVYIMDRWFKPGSSPVLGSLDTNNVRNVIAGAKFTNDPGQGKNFWIGQINHRTKYLTMAFQTDDVISAHAVIYGKVVSETQSNLLWEFITKRHR